jgi:DNA-directed RNA polymerase subunit K/omega
LEREEGMNKFEICVLAFQRRKQLKAGARRKVFRRGKYTKVAVEEVRKGLVRKEVQNVESGVVEAVDVVELRRGSEDGDGVL